MQAALLSKIEELTLHLIEISKQSNTLAGENHDLRTRLSALESKP